MLPVPRTHTHTQAHRPRHRCRRMQTQRVHTQTHAETQVTYSPHPRSDTCTKTQPPYTNMYVAQTGIPHEHMAHPPTFRFPHTRIHAHFPGSSPKAYRAAEASTSLAISSPAGQSRARPRVGAGGVGGGLSQRKSPCPAVFPIPRATSEPGCLLSSQIPPCSPPTQSLPGENHGNTIFPHPGWSRAANTRLRKCCSQAGRYFPYLPLPRPRCLAPPATQLPGCLRESLPQPGVSSSQPRPRQGATETLPE